MRVIINYQLLQTHVVEGYKREYNLFEFDTPISFEGKTFSGAQFIGAQLCIFQTIHCGINSSLELDLDGRVNPCDTPILDMKFL